MTFSVIPAGLKIRHIMRIGIGIAGLLITSAQLMYAGPVNSQPIEQVEVNIELRHASLVQAFSKIESQSPFHFPRCNFTKLQ